MNLGDFISTNAKFGILASGYFDGLGGAQIILKIDGKEIDAVLGKYEDGAIEIRFNGPIEFYYK